MEEAEGQVSRTIRSRLTAAFHPVRLEITDDSARHAGHAGSRPGGESHFTVRIVSDSFAGQSRIDRQRRIFDVLSEELAGPVHALSVKALSPDEDA